MERSDTSGKGLPWRDCKECGSPQQEPLNHPKADGLANNTAETHPSTIPATAPSTLSPSHCANINFVVFIGSSSRSLPPEWCLESFELSRLFTFLDRCDRRTYCCWLASPNHYLFDYLASPKHLSGRRLNATCTALLPLLSHICTFLTNWPGSDQASHSQTTH